LAEASDRVNERTKQELVEKVQAMACPGDTVAVLGVTYKPNTYITEEAAGLFLAQQLKRRGYRVLIHDFAATPANSPSLHEFEVISNLEEVESNPGVKVAVICCPWPQYRDFAPTAGTRVFTPWHL
jgi:UDPglucose 6-dehydrogenase